MRTENTINRNNSLFSQTVEYAAAGYKYRIEKNEN